MGFGQGLLAHSPEPPCEQTQHPPAPAQATGVAKAEAANEQTSNLHGEQREEVEEEVLAVVAGEFSEEDEEEMGNLAR